MGRTTSLLRKSNTLDFRLSLLDRENRATFNDDQATELTRGIWVRSAATRAFFRSRTAGVCPRKADGRLHNSVEISTCRTDASPIYEYRRITLTHTQTHIRNESKNKTNANASAIPNSSRLSIIHINTYTTRIYVESETAVHALTDHDATTRTHRTYGGKRNWRVCSSRRYIGWN